MAFKIAPRLKPEAIKTKSLEMKLLPKYYKMLQSLLLTGTNVETTTDYFFCDEYADGEPLLIMGNATPAYKKVFREAGKGQEGFDKTKISGGKSFILKEDKKTILCIQPDASLGKGKKLAVTKALTKLKRAYMKQIDEVRWLDAPLMATADGSGVESTTSTEESSTGTEPAPEQTTDTTTSNPQPEQSSGTQSGSSDQGPMPIDRDDIVKRAQDLQRGIRKIKDDVMPRYKNEETTPKDAEFVKAMRKAGLLFLTKLTQADSETKKEFNTNKEFLDQALPQWKDLEERLQNSKNRKEMREALKEKLETTVNQMNDIRKQIKEILERTDIKKLA